MSFTESWIQGPQSTQFYTRTYEPQETSTAVVVFIHGFGEHIGRYTHFHLKHAERGLVVFTFDQRGFGKTALDKENKSPDSFYGKTSFNDQVADVAWAIDHAKEKHPTLPIFLVGHSMGGGEVLGFATQPKTSPYHVKLSQISGIVAMSPLVHLTKPASKPLRVIGSFVGKFFPHAPFPADIDASGISRDPKVIEEFKKDSLIQQKGTLRGLDSMIGHGENLLETLYSNWPENLPVLICHGTADSITSFPASQAFYDKLPTQKKKIVPFQDAFHELHFEIEDIPDRLLNEITTFIGEHMPSPPKAKI